MTDFQGYRERTRDIQDGQERGLWGSVRYVDGAGSVMTVRGTDTEDQELPVWNSGFGFTVPKDYNTEVLMVSLNSDTNQKYALPSIPRDKQRQWPENTGGVQNPIDPEKAIQFGPDGTWLKDGTFFLGDAKAVKITVDGGAVVIECDSLDIRSSSLTHNGTNIGDTHVHSQGSDSGGDGEQDTDGPK